MIKNSRVAKSGVMERKVRPRITRILQKPLKIYVNPWQKFSDLFYAL